MQLPTRIGGQGLHRALCSTWAWPLDDAQLPQWRHGTKSWLDGEVELGLSRGHGKRRKGGTRAKGCHECAVRFEIFTGVRALGPDSFFFYETFVLIPEIPATAHTSLCVRAARILAGYYPKFIRDLVSQMVCSWTWWMYTGGHIAYWHAEMMRWNLLDCRMCTICTFPWNSFYQFIENWVTGQC
jgi:hypothetical protein